MSAYLRTLLGLGLLGCALTGQAAFAQDLPILPPLEDEPPQSAPVDPPPFDTTPAPRQLPPEQPAPRRVAPPPPAPESEPMFDGGGIAIQGGIGGSSEILLGFNAGPALFGLGLALGYDPLGASLASGMRSDKTVSFNLAVSFAYMAYNTKPIAFGPEVDFDAALAPGSPFSSSTLRLGFAMWYAPWHAPVYIGTMIGLRVGFVSGGDPSVSTEYPGLRLRWGF